METSPSEVLATKHCFRCGQLKPLAEYYRHPGMGDGHLNKCKKCAREDTARRAARIMADPCAREAALARHREKSRRYRNSGRYTPPPRVKRREANARHRQRNPLANKARAAISNALRSGKVQRQPCERCGEAAQAHHPDHTKPFDVVWLCPEHHAEADNKLRAEKRLAQTNQP